MSEHKVTIEFDDKSVRLFMLASIFWGVVAMLAGVFVASQLSAWQLNFSTEWLTFGRLRPVHTNAAIFAFVGNMMFAGIYYSLPIIGNPSAANAAFASAYENGPLGQSANGPWWSYDGTRLFLGVGVAAGGAAAATMVTEVYVFGSNAIGAARGTYTYLVEVGGLKWTPGAFWSTAQSVARGLVQIRPSGGMPIVRVDFHAIVAGGRRLLHLDFNKWGIKHFPWEIFK